MLLWTGRVVAAGSLAVALLLLVSHRHPYVELISNFRLQLAVVTGLALIALAALRLPYEAAATGLSLAVHAAFVGPLLLSSPDPLVATESTVRVMQYNVLFHNHDFDAIAQEILTSDADVVALHELSTEQWTAIEPLLDDSYPYAIALPLDLERYGPSGSGKALLSRTPISPYPTDHVAEFAAFGHPPLAATTNIGGREILAVALHPSPSRTDPYLVDQRAAKLRATAELATGYDGPAVIISDLNVTPTSPVYRNFLDQLGWDDPRRKIGAEPTWPVGNWDLFSIAIDHIFVSPDIGLHDYEIGDGGGSDHHSLVATISLPR